MKQTEQRAAATQSECKARLHEIVESATEAEAAEMTAIIEQMLESMKGAAQHDKA